MGVAPSAHAPLRMPLCVRPWLPLTAPGCACMSLPAPAWRRLPGPPQLVLRAQEALTSGGARLPYCAFNGGSDAWVDVGNKRVGVTGLQRFLNAKPGACPHVGDQFLSTGNLP